MNALINLLPPAPLAAIVEVESIVSALIYSLIGIVLYSVVAMVEARLLHYIPKSEH